MNKFRLINIFVRTGDELHFGQSEYYPPSGVDVTLRTECILHPERGRTYPPNGVNTTPRAGEKSPSKRSEHYTPSGVNITLRTGQYLCPERDSTSAPSEAVPLHRVRCDSTPCAVLMMSNRNSKSFSFCKNKQHLYRRLLILLGCSGL